MSHSSFSETSTRASFAASPPSTPLEADCYGGGGTAATVTDADLLLGYLNADYFLGGEMRLYPKRAACAIEQSVGKPLGVDAVRAARSIYEVVNDNMANAAWVYAAEHGIDLRDFTLLAFGGAAPTHVCDVAQRLGIRDMPCRSVSASSLHWAA